MGQRFVSLLRTGLKIIYICFLAVWKNCMAAVIFKVITLFKEISSFERKKPFYRETDFRQLQPFFELQFLNNFLTENFMN